MKMKFFVFALASLLLTGCGDEKAMLQKFIPKDDDATARSFIKLVQTGEYGLAEQMLAPKVRGNQANDELVKIHELLDQGQPVEILTIGFNTTIFRTLSQETKKTNLVYQFQFRHTWVVGNVLLSRESDATYVLGAHFHPVRDSLEVLNRFTFDGKTPLHYTVLAFCFLIPAFILYALVVCIRSPVRRKWLWIIFIVLGLFEFRFDWTTGLYDFKPISLLLFGVGVVQSSPYAPWVFELALPIGALVFLMRRRKLILPKPPARNKAV